MSFTVHVEQAINIVREMSSVEVMEPEPAKFQVETSLKSGRPPRWTLNGEVLEHSATVDIDRRGTLHSLQLVSTESSMSGPVVFVAGKSRSTAQLVVKGELTETVAKKFGCWVFFSRFKKMFLDDPREATGGFPTLGGC